jgi:hypothetical protein
MAKKKTVKKKAGKKKALKKKSVKKPAGKKKAAAKASGKKSGSKTVRADDPVNEIRYRCASTCKASPKFAHLTAGSTVHLVAENVDVDIYFLSGSPFVSTATHIQIARGTTVSEVVGATQQHFDYTLVCTNPTCRTSSSNPEMIVP